MFWYPYGYQNYMSVLVACREKQKYFQKKKKKFVIFNNPIDKMLDSKCAPKYAYNGAMRPYELDCDLKFQSLA